MEVDRNCPLPRGAWSLLCTRGQVIQSALVPEVGGGATQTEEGPMATNVAEAQRGEGRAAQKKNLIPLAFLLGTEGAAAAGGSLK